MKTARSVNRPFDAIFASKLVNQISLGIPVKDALMTFARDVNSKTVLRSVELIREAEQAGGNRC